MTIITQTGIILNYRYIREIGLYDAEDETKNYFCVISAKNDKDEEITLAAFSTSDEGELLYENLLNALSTGKNVFSFSEEQTMSFYEQESKPEKEPERPSYKNRFIEKER